MARPAGSCRTLGHIGRDLNELHDRRGFC
jgi:hypothetical protein